MVGLNSAHSSRRTFTRWLPAGALLVIALASCDPQTSEQVLGNLPDGLLEQLQNQYNDGGNSDPSDSQDDNADVASFDPDHSPDNGADSNDDSSGSAGEDGSSEHDDDGDSGDDAADDDSGGEGDNNTNGDDESSDDGDSDDGDSGDDGNTNDDGEDPPPDDGEDLPPEDGWSEVDGLASYEVGDPRVGSPDDPSNVNSFAPHMSHDAQFVAFHCYASNVVSDDTNGVSDVFVYNRVSGVMTRASVHSDGSQADGASSEAQLSGDGQYVVFLSSATNLVNADGNAVIDIFRHDGDSGVTERMSVASSGAEADDASSEPAVSADGRYVAFSSFATNLVTGDTNDTLDVFVRDAVANTTSRVSLSSSGAQANNASQAPSLSDDGRYVAFHSAANNLVSGDTNGTWDVFVRDTVAGTTTRVSVASDGTQADDFCTDAAISGDGRYVAFLSGATNLVAGDTNNRWDIFVHDRQTGVTKRCSQSSAGVQSNGNSYSCEVSGNGAYVVFRSTGSNLVSGDTNLRSDVFLHNVATGVTTRLSVNSSGVQGNDDSYDAALSVSGAQAVFCSEATNLLGDATTPNMIRVFVRSTSLP